MCPLTLFRFTRLEMGCQNTLIPYISKLSVFITPVVSITVVTFTNVPFIGCKCSGWVLLKFMMFPSVITRIWFSSDESGFLCRLTNLTPISCTAIYLFCSILNHSSCILPVLSVLFLVFLLVLKIPLNCILYFHQKLAKISNVVQYDRMCFLISYSK